jgi:glycine betaine transporter
MMSTSKILYATDYSELSQEALKYATSLARATGSKLLITHVSEQELYPVGELFDEKVEPSPQELEQLQAVVPTDTSVACEHCLLHAPPSCANICPADEIVKCAAQEAVDAIVIGTHGRSGLSRLLAGSVASEVMRQADCTVVTIKTPPK